MVFVVDFKGCTLFWLIYFAVLLKDIATRVIACELNLEETPVSKVMTRNPTFVLSDTLAVEALQKMVQGWFRITFSLYALLSSFHLVQEEIADSSVNRKI